MCWTLAWWRARAPSLNALRTAVSLITLAGVNRDLVRYQEALKLLSPE
jgi:hypothetical protein